MAIARRKTISLDGRIYNQLRRRIRAPKDLREWVDQTLRDALLEDIEDAKVFRERAKERSIPFEVVRRRLKRDGLL